MKKNRGIYYGLHFKLINGKDVMVLENLHITTLLEFLKQIFRVLWRKTSTRMRKEYKEIYKGEFGKLLEQASLFFYISLP